MGGPQNYVTGWGLPPDKTLVPRSLFSGWHGQGRTLTGLYGWVSLGLSGVHLGALSGLRGDGRLGKVILFPPPTSAMSKSPLAQHPTPFLVVVVWGVWEAGRAPGKMARVVLT